MPIRTLTTEEVKQLIAGGESLTVEFKSEGRGKLSDREIYETVVCFANAEGGVLLLGVEDDGSATGAQPRHDGETDPNALNVAIFNNTSPQINTRVSVHDIEGVQVTAIEVDPYPEICMTADGKCIRRIMGFRGPECRPFLAHEHSSRRSDLRLIDHSAELVEWATSDDLESLEIERLRNTIRRLHGDQALLELDDRQLIQALQLVESQEGRLVPNVAGMLLAGREESLRRAVPTAQIAFQVFGESGRVLLNDWFFAPVAKVLEEIESRFNARNEESEIMIGMHRLPIPRRDTEAFREAVNNAVLHRDYSRQGAVYIQIYPDRLSISNPGGFLEGISQDNLLVIEPKGNVPGSV